jgi:hypothetical protein
MRFQPPLFAIAVSVAAAINAAAGENADPLRDPSFFPISVWLQDPSRAPQYKAIGINVFVALWKGPTETQLAELSKHGMRVVWRTTGKSSKRTRRDQCS